MRLSLSEHPATVGESYFEHMRQSSGFGVAMLAGGLACLVHALLPFLFLRTGSTIITKLHQRMVVNRSRVATRAPETAGIIIGA